VLSLKTSVITSLLWNEVDSELDSTWALMAMTLNARRFKNLIQLPAIFDWGCSGLRIRSPEEIFSSDNR
jgi:hypothetical protein